MSHEKKLDVFQRGLPQIITAFVAAVSILWLTTVIVDSFGKWGLITIFDVAQRQGFIMDEGPQPAKIIIELIICLTIYAILLWGLNRIFTWPLVKRILNQNWSRPVTLPKAVEFYSAMLELGATEPDEWNHIIIKHKLSVFIATLPLSSDEQKNVDARRYTFGRNRALIDKKVWAHRDYQKTLCLDADDYKRVSQKHNELTQEIATLRAEKAEFQRSEQTAPARGKVAQNREQRRIIFHRVAIPFINRLNAEADKQGGIKYTRTKIQIAFFIELEKYPDLKEEILKLSCAYDEEKGTYFLRVWAMEYIRRGLGENVQKVGGAGKKSKATEH